MKLHHDAGGVGAVSVRVELERGGNSARLLERFCAGHQLGRVRQKLDQGVGVPGKSRAAAVFIYSQRSGDTSQL